MSKVTNIKKAKSKKGHSSPCYHSHPALVLCEKRDIQIWGGNCRTPIVKDADVYVGFDPSMAGFDKMYPWHDEVAFLYRITDMSVPSKVEEFMQLIEWLEVQLIAQKKVHLGCIGGHGRTGMVMAALRAKLTGDKDATSYVREGYCHKAVESQKQINFLHKHFGIKKVKPTKTHGHHTGSAMAGSQHNLWPDEWYQKYEAKSGGGIRLDEDMDIEPIPAQGSVWGKNTPKK